MYHAVEIGPLRTKELLYYGHYVPIKKLTELIDSTNISDQKSTNILIEIHQNYVVNISKFTKFYTGCPVERFLKCFFALNHGVLIMN